MATWTKTGKTFERQHSAADRFLDIMASRWVGFLVLVVVLGVAAISYGLISQGQTSARQAQSLFEGPTVRENAHAISDIYRLQFAANQIASTGSRNEQTVSDFLAALDFLYVRAENLGRSLMLVDYREDSARALSSMHRMIEISDSAITNGFADLGTFQSQLTEAARSAQSELVQYMNALHIDQQGALTNAVSSLEALTRLHFLFLLAMLIFSVSLLFLLRREVLIRKDWSEAEARVTYIAYHDDLTGLGNRATFHERALDFFDRAKTSELRNRSLIVLDLDDFKEINDAFGHPVGDAVLCHIAEILKAVAEKHDAIPVRVAGDEFAMFLKTGKSLEIRRIADDIINEVRKPLSLQDNVIMPHLSIGGVAARDLDDSQPITLESMSRAADYALYAAKRSPGRNNVRLFDDALATQLRQRRERLKALETAIETDAIEVWLQPQVDLFTLELSGFEALARWTHNGVFVPPDEFVAIAEDNGLIADLDAMMLRRATQAMADWNTRHGAEVAISVNVSASNIGSPRLMSAISTALGLSKLPPQLLTLELTETVEVRDWKQVVDKMTRIRALGCKLSIDDFGSGYSSLGYLRKMPAHELKIDRSLVTGIESSEEGRSIVSSVVDIAHSLRFVTVVEGIETIEQARIARHLGCTHAQGYLFGKPLPHQKVPAPDKVLPDPIMAEMKRTASGDALLSKDPLLAEGSPLSGTDIRRVAN